MVHYFKVTVLACFALTGLSGCELLDGIGTKNTVPIKTMFPNPKPRPKTEPAYPSTTTVIAWHALSCGGFSLEPDKKQYVGKKEIQSYFNFSCKNNTLTPEKVLTMLLQLDQAYYWPDDIKHYWWLQKQQIKQQINAKKEQQALNDKMQMTLSSLASIEQQLLLREETKEQ